MQLLYKQIGRDCCSSERAAAVACVPSAIDRYNALIVVGVGFVTGVAASLCKRASLMGSVMRRRRDCEKAPVDNVVASNASETDVPHESEDGRARR